MCFGLSGTDTKIVPAITPLKGMNSPMQRSNAGNKSVPRFWCLSPKKTPLIAAVLPRIILAFQLLQRFRWYVLTDVAEAIARNLAKVRSRIAAAA